MKSGKYFGCERKRGRLSETAYEVLYFIDVISISNSRLGCELEKISCILCNMIDVNYLFKWESGYCLCSSWELWKKDANSRKRSQRRCCPDTFEMSPLSREDDVKNNFYTEGKEIKENNLVQNS